MTIQALFKVVIHCDWETTTEPAWGCTHSFEHTEEPTGQYMHSVISRARVAAKAAGWEQLTDPTTKVTTHRCPGCIGRRTDTKERDEPANVVAEAIGPGENDGSIYVERFARFMSIKASPAELARWLNKRTPGVTWTGSAKRDMAMAYASRTTHNSARAKHPTITRKMVDQLLTEYGVKGKQ